MCGTIDFQVQCICVGGQHLVIVDTGDLSVTHAGLVTVMDGCRVPETADLAGQGECRRFCLRHCGPWSEPVGVTELISLGGSKACTSLIPKPRKASLFAVKILQSAIMLLQYCH